MGYKTRQHGEILSFLQSSKGSHVTANDVCCQLEKNGVKIGKATVYRQLDSLVESGVLNKYFIDENSGACFEFIDVDNDCHEECYHCKCEKCGRLIHLACEEIGHLAGHIKADHGFVINAHRTVFYGICAECSSAEVK